MNIQGYLAIVLHAHLPFVRHPEYDHFFEENWLFEAITECYIPLIKTLDRLEKDQVNFRLTLSLSPTLISMLLDELLQERYIRHLEKQLELAEKEIVRTRKHRHLHSLASWYRGLFSDTLKIYQDQYQGDLLSAFKKHYLLGNLELITCAATHGFLPLLSVNELSVLNQINIGLDVFKHYFDFMPTGFWLPECGFYPGLEKYLEKAGINYFFSDTHGILLASQQPVNDVYAPLDCGNGVAVFARDPESSSQVWSSEQGYPGDFDYREYHSDIGFDLDLEYISPYILDGEIRVNTGFKYHRVTGGTRPKQIYQPVKAYKKAQIHARDFLEKRQQQISCLADSMDRLPIIISPYDAELFGHWWFEGPVWLEFVLRFADETNSTIKTVSCRDYLQQFKTHQLAIPSASSWGDEGYSSYWINETNDWIYPVLHKAGKDMQDLATDFFQIPSHSIIERALNQAARSLLLAQSSDWAFIIKSGTTTEYAKKRIVDHLARFNYLRESIRNNEIDERTLSALEILDDIFPNIDFRDYAKLKNITPALKRAQFSS
jgi:1,4-alpha-glucan branching enzyme